MTPDAGKSFFKVEKYDEELGVGAKGFFNLQDSGQLKLERNFGLRGSRIVRRRGGHLMILKEVKKKTLGVRSH